MKICKKNTFQKISLFSLSLFAHLGVCGFPSAVGPDRDLYARQDPHAEDFSDPDLQGASVAEDPRECGDGSVPGVRPGVGRSGD